jgi:hypothetical protein
VALASNQLHVVAWPTAPGPVPRVTSRQCGRDGQALRRRLQIAGTPLSSGIPVARGLGFVTVPKGEIRSHTDVFPRTWPSRWLAPIFPFSLARRPHSCCGIRREGMLCRKGVLRADHAVMGTQPGPRFFMWENGRTSGTQPQILTACGNICRLHNCASRRLRTSIDISGTAGARRDQTLSFGCCSFLRHIGSVPWVCCALQHNPSHPPQDFL